MKGVHPDTCIHHIYTQGEVTPIRQPQRRMNPTLKDIVKEDIQKLLNVKFIYPISDSKWLSPLVVVPNKVIGKWRICVDFRELNKATLKDYFPLPFIDQVLDTFFRKEVILLSRWVQRVQPNYYSTQGPGQDYLYLSLGHLCL